MAAFTRLKLSLRNRMASEMVGLAIYERQLVFSQRQQVFKAIANLGALSYPRMCNAFASERGRLRSTLSKFSTPRTTAVVKGRLETTHAHSLCCPSSTLP